MQNNNSNILVAFLLSAAVLIGWTWFYEKPKIENFKKQQEIARNQELTSSKTSQDKENIEVNNQQYSNLSQKTTFSKKNNEAINRILVYRDKSLQKTKNQRISINSDRIFGSINLKGAKFDDLSLKDYKETIESDSDNVHILSPADSKQRYFADFGWVSSGKSIDLPNANTIWTSESKELKPNQKVTLSWKNKQNILFLIDISIDKNYVFNIIKTVNNLSNERIDISSYGRINRILNKKLTSNYILHEGPIAVFDNILHEIKYDDLKKENNQNYSSKKSWLGITDKYWLTSMIVDDYETESSFSVKEGKFGDIYNVSFIGRELGVMPGEILELNYKFFAGAKEVKLLDKYSSEYNIDLFDRAVDFGWYYFLTKPFFFILEFFNELFGNYGLAILAITISIKIVMLPLANKSYKAMARIKKLHPQIDEIRKRNKGNKMQVSKDTMELYKSEKVNPASGCLPMLVQIPVFFSLYKVLYVTIDMRHQPFYGWIKDLSAPDPTSIFNLFSLLPFEISGGLFMIGVWPILMGLTMVLQQKLGPKISDPTQAKVMKILPLILIFIFAAFPAGLLIYWTWNNILSITQQYVINKKIESESNS